MELRTEVFALVARGRRAWVPAGRNYPIELEFVYKEDELTRALYVYAATTARFLPVEKGRFRLTAHSLTVGGLVGMHEWCVSEESGRWVPTGAPWVAWDEWVQLAA
ncbi:hypothetical protein [Kitasatospora purpeofusca]|uniref:hypothetical protein n=1 Tax=Kitasatospora purpeofusca TaxID=67352 RepID=UPI00380524C5